MTERLFSIVTSSFRGSQFLPRAYESILNQRSNKGLEWIIVDDFSDDCGRTRDAIELIRRNAPFAVKTIFLDRNYYGSKSAYSGASIATGEYTIILDQDDMLAETALEVFAAGIETFRDDPKFAGVCGRCVDLSGVLIGTPFPWREKLSNELYVRHREKIRGELFQCTRTDLIVEAFKEMKPGYTNGWAWAKIARKYEYLYTSEVVRHYDTTNPTSTTNTKKLVYLDAQFETLKHYLMSNADYLRFDKWATFRMLAQCYRIGRHCGISKNELDKNLPRYYRGLSNLSYWVAMVKVHQDRRIGLI